MPTGPLELSGISDPSPWNHSTRQTINVTVTNLTGNRQVARVSWYLASENSTQPWVGFTARGLPVQVTLEPWATRVVTVRAVSVASAGHWELSAFAHYQVSPGTFSQADALWLAATLTVN